MGEIEELKTAFPLIEIKELQGGANLYTPRGLITVYFKKRKYAINNKWSQYSYWQDFIPLVDKHINPPDKVAKIVSESPTNEELEAMFRAHNQEQGEIAKEQLDAYIESKSKQGVQSCINHIKRKAEYGKKNNLNPSNIVMLNNLAEELRQYL